MRMLVIFGLLSLRLLCAQTFTETFNEGTLNTSVWTASNYETNNYAGGGSNVTFSPSNISLAGGNLQMTLTQPTSGTSTGAELTSNASFGYGTYQFSMRAGSTSATSGGTGTPESGQISSTFIIDGSNSITEIDAPEIEGLAARSNNIEWDIWKNGVSTVPSPEFNVLANPEAAFHVYKFVWTSTSITFYIDGTLVSAGTAGIPTAPAVIDINFYGTNSTGWGGNATVGVTRYMYVNSVSYTPLAAPSGWPGQSGNPVGYAAYGPLGTTPWPGGGFTSGTSGNPTVYVGYVFTGAQTISGSYITFISCDFNSGTGGVSVTGSNIKFIGTRFQSNNVENENVQISGGTNITFSYSSFVPLASLYTSPPGSVWPSAGAGQNTTTQTTNVNAINGNSGYEYGLNITSGGPVTVDHSDFWGYGNAVVLYSTTAQMNITNNWIHDAANASPQGYHTDGVGYLNGGAGPSNVLVQGNTIASLGNTNGLAFQAATSGYNNIQFIKNYLSGFGFTVAAGAPGNTHFTNSSIVQNVWGTDVEPVWNPLYGNSWTAGANSVWKCNTLVFRSGTTWTDGDGWTPPSSINGQYWIPTSAIASATDWNGNLYCPSASGTQGAPAQQFF